MESLGESFEAVLRVDGYDAYAMPGTVLISQPVVPPVIIPRQPPLGYADAMNGEDSAPEMPLATAVIEKQEAHPGFPLNARANGKR
ncbi:hypothetical protein PsorP6_014173 [Peronosclerospora sorghi]|uniref:Uncharacterized protein n=1 Tax=Peronosclerospora sorghi TaxID=230839 RepID=A0ACC0VJ83_9STRA|nr:hypothetical protein PsorP6_014173 [Peronosclerospora sorghi]